MIGLLLWIALSCVCSLVGALLFGKLTVLLAAFSLAFSAVLAYRLAALMPQQASRRSDVFEKSLVGFIALIGFYQFLTLIFASSSEVRIGNANNLGDLPMHINMIQAFARGISFWPENLEWAGDRLRYPFAMNLWNAQWEILGLPLRAHLIVTGFALFLCGLRAVWLGYGLITLVAIYAGVGLFNTDFKNFLLSVFVTQRGFLWAFPAGIYILKTFEDLSGRSKIEKGVWVFLMAVMPFFHLHTFLFLGLYMLARWLFQRDLQTFRLGLLALVLALPFLLMSLVGGQNVGGALGFLKLWTWSEQMNMNPLLYVARNFSVFLPAVALIIYDSIRRRSYQGLIAPILFLIFLFVKVAPWPWDNIKVLLWAYLLTWAAVEKLYERRMDLRSYKWALCVLLFFPGLVQLYQSLPSQAPGTGFSGTRLTMECDWKMPPVNDVIAAAPDFDHPILWQGAKMVYGYEGHLWSHGYRYGDRKEKLERLMRGEPDWRQAAKDLGVKWLLWSQNEISHFRVEKPMWTQELTSHAACQEARWYEIQN